MKIVILFTLMNCIYFSSIVRASSTDSSEIEKEEVTERSGSREKTRQRRVKKIIPMSPEKIESLFKRNKEDILTFAKERLSQIENEDIFQDGLYCLHIAGALGSKDALIELAELNKRGISVFYGERSSKELESLFTKTAEEDRNAIYQLSQKYIRSVIPFNAQLYDIYHKKALSLHHPEVLFYEANLAGTKGQRKKEKRLLKLAVAEGNLRAKKIMSYRKRIERCCETPCYFCGFVFYMLSCGCCEEF